MRQHTIPGAWANELLYGDESNVKIVSRTEIDERRWYFRDQIVFTIPGVFGFYAIDVDRPKHEDHPYDTWDRDAEVPIKLMRPRLVTITVFEEFEDEE